MKILFAFLLVFLIASIGCRHIGKQGSAPVSGTSTSGRLPVGSPLTTFYTRQTVIGTYTDVVPQYFESGTEPCTIIVEPGVGYILNQTDDFAIQWTFNNGTYLLEYNDDIDEFFCWYSFYGTYANLTKAYENAVKIDEYGIYDRYIGYVNDYGECGYGTMVQFLINSLDNTIWRFAGSAFTPLLYDYPFISAFSQLRQAEIAFPGVGTIPPLPEVCWSLNVSDPTTNYCYDNHYGFLCTGWGEYPCQPNPGPYIPE